MRKLLVVGFVALVALVAGCATTSSCCGNCADPQAVVEQVAKDNPSVTRLTVHCQQADGTAIACASTLASKKDQPSDPEDLQAMQKGEPVVLVEANGLDVTIPFLQKDGKFRGACGVTFADKAMPHAQALAAAQAIAKTGDAGVGSCCTDCACGTACKCQ